MSSPLTPRMTLIRPLGVLGTTTGTINVDGGLPFSHAAPYLGGQPGRGLASQRWRARVCVITDEFCDELRSAVEQRLRTEAEPHDTPQCCRYGDVEQF
jgi:hypothetical protein